MEVLNKENPLVKMFRMARDRFSMSNNANFKIRLVGRREKDGRVYNLPTVEEVVVLIVGDIDVHFDERDILLQSQDGHLQRISELHPAYLALQYPLLFPYGEDGYRVDIFHRGVDETTSKKKKRVTMRDFFAYMIQMRPNVPSLLQQSRKLFQQFLVDAYTMVESERISYIRRQQSSLRSATYKKLSTAMTDGNTEIEVLGKRVILPSSFTGSARYMMQNYLDAMAICRTYGNPDLFITFTCNPKWPEMVRLLKKEKLRPEDKAESISRMFKIKLKRLIKDLTENKILGAVEAGI